jgi:hypothetical protein
MQAPHAAIPKLRTEAEERRFWQTHNTTPDVNWSTAELVRLANLNAACQASAHRPRVLSCPQSRSLPRGAVMGGPVLRGRQAVA